MYTGGGIPIDPKGIDDSLKHELTDCAHKSRLPSMAEYTLYAKCAHLKAAGTFHRHWHVTMSVSLTQGKEKYLSRLVQGRYKVSRSYVMTMGFSICLSRLLYTRLVSHNIIHI